MIETNSHFARRVTRATGCPYNTIPRGVEADPLGGQIVARRGQEYVVTFGYASFASAEIARLYGRRGFESATGAVWSGPAAFRRVVLG